MELQISDTLKLPMEALTETFAVLGKRGSGKTNFGVVLVEELVGAGLPVVVIDPVGVWFGLRSSADGKSAGLPVTILGGEHGDVPLEEGAGAVIADFVIDARQSCVIDLSLFRKGQAVRFMTDFAERLYHAKGAKRDALHIVVDEADAFAPQNPRPESARLLGAMEDLVRRGRSRGLGLTLITQRAASLNKNVLTQAEVLVVFQLVGPLDRKAIDEWVKMNGSEEDRAQLLASIASLPVGTAWVWSPSWLKTFLKIGVRRRRTFDSSATPKAGATRIDPRVFAPVDLKVLRDRIADTIERAKADDPRELRKRIVQLQKLLHDKPITPPPEPHVVTVSVFSEVDINRIEIASRAVTDATRLATEATSSLMAALVRAKGASSTPPTRPITPRLPESVQPRTETLREKGARPATSRTSSVLGKCERAILSVLATHGTRNKFQLAIQAGYSSNSGGYRNALGALRSSGLIDGGGEAISITSEGCGAAGEIDPLPRGRALIEYWMANAGGKCERMILEALAAHHPRPMTKEQVAAQSGYEPTSGGFRNALGRLRSLQLISSRGDVALTDTLAEAAS